MARRDENAGFTCAHCGESILPLTNGSYRNHCPVCLYSLHVDQSPGDRAAKCNGLMKPVGLRFKQKKGWQIVHQCMVCGTTSVCRVAVETAQPDNVALLATLS